MAIAQTRPFGQRYAFVVVAVIFLSLLIAAGLRSSLSVMMLPLEDCVRLAARRDLAGGRGRHLHLRPCRSVRGGADGAYRPAPDAAWSAGPDVGIDRAQPADDRAVASHRHLGRAVGHRLGRRRHGARRDHRQSLVQDQSRPDDGPDVGQCRDRPAGLPAVAGDAGRAWRLEAGGDRRFDCHGGAAAAGLPAGPRAAVVDRPVALRRRWAGAGSCCRARQLPDADAVDAAQGRRHARVLVPFRHFLRLRLHHQRPRRRPSDRVLRRHGHPGSAGGRPARADGRVRPDRHHAVRLADRPLRPAQAARRLLRRARPVADLPAALRLLGRLR